MKRRWLLALLLPMVVASCGYNKIQALDEQATAARSTIEVQLQRRADLIPNLVQTVKGYAQHEDTVFTRVAEARAKLAGSIQTHNPTAMANADAQLTGSLSRLLAISENYPQLKANENFLRLQDELAGTENRIAVARTDYNQAAQQYNTYIRTFPQVVTGKAIGAKPKPYFQVTSPGAEQAPKVDFTTPAPAAPATSPPASAPKVP
ncbi:MAG TPA: LemA family protein [Gemmatimonadaceae bacterium]|nr:LemA family protein [Gemmatimonadaceae bacterium]